MWDECETASDLAQFLTGCCQGSAGGFGCVCVSACKLVHARACMRDMWRVSVRPEEGVFQVE